MRPTVTAGCPSRWPCSPCWRWPAGAGSRLDRPVRRPSPVRPTPAGWRSTATPRPRHRPAKRAAAAPQRQRIGTAVETPLQQRAVVRTASLSVTVRRRGSGGRQRAGRDQGRRRPGRRGRPERGLGRPACRVGAAGAGRQAGRADSHREPARARGQPDRARRRRHRQPGRCERPGAGVDHQRGRLQDFLKHSGSISDLVALESQLTQRESDLQSTVAQQRALSDQMDLSTLTVDLHTKAGAVRTGSGPAGFGSAVRHALGGVLLSLRWLAALFGYLLPFLVVLASPGVPAALWWRAQSAQPTGTDPTAAAGHRVSAVSCRTVAPAPAPTRRCRRAGSRRCRVPRATAGTSPPAGPPIR